MLRVVCCCTLQFLKQSNEPSVFVAVGHVHEYYRGVKLCIIVLGWLCHCPVLRLQHC